MHTVFEVDSMHIGHSVRFKDSKESMLNILVAPKYQLRISTVHLLLNAHLCQPDNRNISLLIDLQSLPWSKLISYNHNSTECRVVV